MTKIAICAGHGLYTNGKGVPTMKEWEFNNAVALYVLELLKKYEVEVLLVSDPTGKRDVPLKERTDQANAWKANVYISIHANAASPTARGVETFTHTSKEKESVELATKVQTEIMKVYGLEKYNRGVKASDFHVLRETNMTAILIEAGFMTNDEDLKLLKSDDYRKKVAKAILNALILQYGIKLKAVPKPIIKVAEPTKKYIYKVQCGAFSSETNAKNLLAQLEKAGFKGVIVREEK